MAITSKYVLVCDEVRQESNGKFIIIGLYAPDMGIPQIPALLQTLTFFVALDSDRPGNYQFKVSLQHLETGAVVSHGMGGFGIQRPGTGVFPMRMANVQLNAPGAYLFTLQIEGERDPITASFNVALNGVPGQQGFPMPR